MDIAFLVSCLVLHSSSWLTSSQSFLGVNYGDIANNLPQPEQTAELLKSTTIQKVRLFGVNEAILKALADTGISIAVGISNGDIPSFASNPAAAAQWINSNVLPHYPASNISLVTVGNEVLMSGDNELIRQLLPAMMNIQNTINSVSLAGKVRVTTVHSMAVLSQSDPPSSAAFNQTFQYTMRSLLQFQRANYGSPFSINPYPYFAFKSDPRPETLNFCLFQPNSGRLDTGNGIRYMNMFDAQVDAIRSALNSVGFSDIEIMVAETGWPHQGDENEAGPSLENAMAYNGNLISHLRSMVGTPLMPGKSVDTYIFALYDENLKPGPASERAFGLFKPDLSMIYNVNLLKNSSSQATGGSVSKKPEAPVWCLPMDGINMSQLQANLDYACGKVECGSIQYGGACYEPNSVRSHAAFAMNLYCQTVGCSTSNCDFSGSGILCHQDPSYGSCIYPEGSNNG